MVPFVYGISSQDCTKDQSILESLSKSGLWGFFRNKTIRQMTQVVQVPMVDMQGFSRWVIVEAGFVYCARLLLELPS